VGSNAPVSPYNANTANPQIAVSDSLSEGLPDMTGTGENNYTYTVAKPIALVDNFYQSGFRESFAGHHIGMGDMNMTDEPPALIRAQHPRQGTLAPGAQASNMSAHSVASSTGGDSPATPSLPENDGGKNGEAPEFPLLSLSQSNSPDPDSGLSQDYMNDYSYSPCASLAFASGNVPKLARTITDVFGDELYDPSFAMTSPTPTQKSHITLSSNNELFRKRLNAANSQHLAAAQSPLSSDARDLSPFRQDSPYASGISELPQVGTNKARLESEQQRRERSEAEQGRRQQQQLAQASRGGAEQQSTPTTISPKDAVLDFNEAECDSNFPLFPPHEASTFGPGNKINRNTMNGAGTQQSVSPFPSIPATPVQNGFDFSMPSNINLLHTYPYVQRQISQQQTPSASTYSRMSSAEASNAEVSSSDGHVQRPDRTAADGGTYTCTYHGCTLRFDTPALLQKHKREGHRQANVLNHLRNPVLPMHSAANSQAGPHRCDRINPSTGKPCNTVFSRPYDLTRHEDTIHNARKQKVRCDLCTEEKTFSRADALTRHYRVCHPDVEFPGKHRKRGGTGL